MNQRVVWSLLIRQAGVISRQQALDLGHSRAQIERFIRIGEWLSVHPTVYRHAACSPSPEGSVRAAAVEFDIAFPELKIAIELDGFAFHSSQSNCRPIIAGSET